MLTRLKILLCFLPLKITYEYFKFLLLLLPPRDVTAATPTLLLPPQTWTALQMHAKKDRIIPTTSTSVVGPMWTPSLGTCAEAELDDCAIANTATLNTAATIVTADFNIVDAISLTLLKQGRNQVTSVISRHSQMFFRRLTIAKFTS